MKLAYYRSDPTNFGDELNAYLWPRLLPANFLDEDDQEIFVGIGSILGDIYPANSIKHVIGSGYAGYFPKPDFTTGKWNIVFVRGPETARRLNLTADKPICDSGILIREVLDLPEPATDINVAFVPHFDSLLRGNWPAACRKAGITMVNPTDSPERVIAQLRGARLVITEAMHGAIIADALRTPWLAVRPFHVSHRMKWSDWSDSLGINLIWQKLPPSSLLELVTKLTGRGSLKMQKRLGWLKSGAFAPAQYIATSLAAARLRKLARGKGQLSSDSAITIATAKAKRALDNFVAEILMARDHT